MKGERGSKVDWSIDKIENARSLPLLMNERLVNIVTAGGNKGHREGTGDEAGYAKNGERREGMGTSVHVYAHTLLYVWRSLTLCNVGTKPERIAVAVAAATRRDLHNVYYANLGQRACINKCYIIIQIKCFNLHTFYRPPAGMRNATPA